MKQTGYRIPAGFHRSEIEVERSRFITSIEPVATTEAALAFVARIKHEFPDANHNCWAYLVGSPESRDKLGLSDDGEPHGVAGRPMLTVLEHGDVGDVVVVVTRFFGGVKLGKGGMVKAYTQAVKDAFKLLLLSKKVDWRKLQARFDYSQLAAIERLLPEFGAEVVERQFDERIGLHLKLPAERVDPLFKALTDLTSGRIAIDLDL